MQSDLKTSSSPIWKKPYKFFGMRFGVSKRGDSYGNSRSDLKTSKLAQKVVGATGFEPTTSTPPE